jgi:hypothetical protein
VRACAGASVLASTMATMASVLVMAFT